MPDPGAEGLWGAIRRGYHGLCAALLASVARRRGLGMWEGSGMARATRWQAASARHGGVLLLGCNLCHRL